MNKINETLTKLKTLMTKNKKLTIIAAVLIICAFFALLSVAKSNSPIEINLDDYVSDYVYIIQEEGDEYDQYNFSGYGINTSDTTQETGLGIQGYDGYASVDMDSIENVIDWNRLTTDVNKMLDKKYDMEMNIDLYDFFDSNSLQYQVDKTEGISNGDTISLTIGTKQEYSFGDVKIKVKSSTYTYKVSGLETANVFDPFEYVTLAERYENGRGCPDCLVDDSLKEEVKNSNGLVVVSDGYGNGINIYDGESTVASIKFYFANKDWTEPTFKNGDKVTMYCKLYGSNFEESYEIHIARYEKEFTFENLGKFANTKTEYSQDDLDKFISEAENYMSKNENEYRKNFKFDSIYFSEIKDKANIRVSGPHRTFNILYIVLSCDCYEYSNGVAVSQSKGYVALKYFNIALDENGKIQNNPEFYFTNNDLDSGIKYLGNPNDIINPNDNNNIFVKVM